MLGYACVGLECWVGGCAVEVGAEEVVCGTWGYRCCFVDGRVWDVWRVLVVLGCHILFLFKGLVRMVVVSMAAVMVEVVGGVS